MDYKLYYIAVKSSLHSLDTTVFGLQNNEKAALSSKFGGSLVPVVNGDIIKAPPVQLINCLSELGYKVCCCSGETELTWTMMPQCSNNNQIPSVCQTLDELDFERGIWFAAQHNDITRVKQLLNKGKDVNETDKSGYTALHYASRNGHFDMCQLLISQGADVHALTHSGRVSSLHRCATTGHINIFRLLLAAGADIYLSDGDGKTVLHRALENEHIELGLEINKLAPELKTVLDNRGKLPSDYTKHSQKNLFQ